MVNERGSSDGLLGPEDCECDQFVEHHARPEQVADDGAIVPRNADQPGDGREQHAERSLDARWKPADVAMNAAHDAIEQVDQRDKCDQHGTDIERHVQAVAGAAGDGAEKIFVLFFFRFILRA